MGIRRGEIEMELEKLLALDVSGYVEKKNGLSYLSWANAWREFIKIYPQATYTIFKDEYNNCYFGNEKIGYMVFTTVTVEDLTHEMWLPVMDYKNKSMLTPTTFDINKTIMRCLTKNLAMFGLGLYIYAGEDLPEDTQSDVPEKEKVDTTKKIEKIYIDSIIATLKDTNSDVESFLTYMDVEKIEDITMGDFMKKAKPALDAKLKQKK
jgi:hypothetical protein